MVVAEIDWIDAPAEALVLSANNHLALESATGNAGSLHTRCPDLHDQIRASVELPMRPGMGTVTGGPNRNHVIHAVTVEYARSGTSPGASTSSVAAACEFALSTAISSGYRSLAFSPMCTRGHARPWMQRTHAEMWMPTVQAGVIGARLGRGRCAALETVLHCLRPSQSAEERDKNVVDAERYLATVRNFL